MSLTKLTDYQLKVLVNNFPTNRITTRMALDTITLRAENERLRNALKEARLDAGRLSARESYFDYDKQKDICPHCLKESERIAAWKPKIIHTPDCPITLHRELIGRDGEG